MDVQSELAAVQKSPRQILWKLVLGSRFDEATWDDLATGVLHTGAMSCYQPAPMSDEQRTCT